MPGWVFQGFGLHCRVNVFIVNTKIICKCFAWCGLLLPKNEPLMSFLIILVLQIWGRKNKFGAGKTNLEQEKGPVDLTDGYENIT